MRDPFENQRATQRLTGEIRELLAERHQSIIESLRQSYCPESDFDGACGRFLPQLAKFIGCSDATTLDELIHYDLSSRQWAIE